MATALERMERQGLIKQVRVEITGKGENVYRRQHQQRSTIHTILGGLNPEEREVFRSVLRKLWDYTLSELVPRPPLP